MLEFYRQYFDIDPEYFPQVNEDIINNQPDHWKKFYPHETFVKLLKDTISVLSRKQRVSLWVEGAYGTGKSHAVLTLKKLLEASEEDTKEYFDKYKEHQLPVDLYNSLQQIKNSGQKILTVHKYGSSNIFNDYDLVFAVQESISRALKNAGFKNDAEKSLKDSALSWFAEDWAKDAFNKLIKTDYLEDFNGEDVDSIIDHLNEYTGEALQELMSNIMKVGREKQFLPLKLDPEGLSEWIKSIIKENDLKAIFFIWDEFSEYFRNNKNGLTGFQKLVDISGNDPFYLLIVTHSVTHLFPANDKDWKKVMDRFLQPVCKIELPENMAFRLMGQAMEENKDPQIQKDWKTTKDTLYKRTFESRDLVRSKANITEQELKNILPIHPYAALILKHISSTFNSNQRSMFDFIKNDRGDEIKGFQWFIDNFGPLDENPLLTIDMLWDFFYEKGKESISPDIKSILDCYHYSGGDKLKDSDEQRVFKTVLLLQAISQQSGGAVDLFIPNEENINLAFEGSDLDNYEASKIANRLVPNYLFKKFLQGGKAQYSALISSVDLAEIEKEKENQKDKVTAQLINEADMASVFVLEDALSLRYDIKIASLDNFKKIINNEREMSDESKNNTIKAIAYFAKNDQESSDLDKLVKEALSTDSYDLIFIDAARNPLGKDLLDQYTDAMANSIVNQKQNKGLAEQYSSTAKSVLKQWRKRVEDGEFIIYTNDKKEGERVNTLDSLYKSLERLNRFKFKEGLESVSRVNSTMWGQSHLPKGVECGLREELNGIYASNNEKTRLDKYIGDAAWQVEKYWKKSPYLWISKLKIFVEKLIQREFEKNGQISISEIYDSLADKNGDYGIMPCNLTAFVLGFILKEYVNGSYNWTDGIYSEPLTVDKLKDTVAEIIKHRKTPLSHYKDKFICKMKPEEKAFNEAASEIFDIPLNLCTSAENTRDKIRNKMRGFQFPIWVLKNLTDSRVSDNTDSTDLKKLIDGFCGIANNANSIDSKTDKEIALEVGKLCRKNPSIIKILSNLLTKENILEGMDKYLSVYADGDLIKLSALIGDNKQYINSLREKFELIDAANWAWGIETANQKIDELILEYKIINKSNEFIPRNTSFKDTIKGWCDICSNIRISYQYAKNSWDELSTFMEMLYNLKKNNRLDLHPEKFLDQLVSCGAKFNEFYRDQIPFFKKIYPSLLDEFNDREISVIFYKLQDNLFTAEKSSYQSILENVVERFKSEQGTEKLSSLWKERTKSESPEDWSTIHRTPILYMVDEDDVVKAKEIFNTINNKYPDSDAIEKAIKFIENSSFIDKLTDPVEIDRAFKKYIIRDYDVILKNLDEVRTYLMETIKSNPYDWFGLPAVDDQLRNLANRKYNETGCNEALQIIDDMDIVKVKQYLKDLIKGNLVVGMEIIKGSK